MCMNHVRARWCLVLHTWDSFLHVCHSDGYWLLFRKGAVLMSTCHWTLASLSLVYLWFFWYTSSCAWPRPQVWTASCTFLVAFPAIAFLKSRDLANLSPYCLDLGLQPLCLHALCGCSSSYSQASHNCCCAAYQLSLCDCCRKDCP